jgi:uncharacterized iron-regulated protein
MNRQLAVLCLSVALVPALFADDPPAWSAPPLERSLSVRDGRTGEPLSFDALLDALAAAEAVFLGEQHTDENTHRVELGVYEGLLARKPGQVVLAMEMFERDVQGDLDAYLGREIDEAAFLERARPWRNYRTAYRPLIEKARAAGAPVVASNFPTPLRRRIGMEGQAILESLDTDARRQAPARFLANTPAYWRRVDNAIRSHRAMMGGGQGGDDQRLFSTQSLWDNSMGEACADALDRRPGATVLHVNGAFHSAYWDGTVRQLLLRRPATKVLTVDIVPVANPSVAEVGGAPVADYVVFSEARATDVNEGRFSVYVPREQHYRLHLPAGSQAGAAESSSVAEERLPLLIWLSDDGLTAEDGLELWKSRLGGEAAIVVLEPAFPQTEADLSQGGRWFRPDEFSSDIGAMILAIDRTWGYILRHYPVDARRVCIAGEGTGATVAAATALLSDHINGRAVALHPRHYAKIKDFPLPLPELRGADPAPDMTLRVVIDESGAEWWKGEIAEYAEIGFAAELTPATPDPWMTEVEAENTLRAALGLELRRAPETSSLLYLVAEADSPRGRHWSRLEALRVEDESGQAVALVDAPPADDSATPISTGVRAEAYANGSKLPRCPGPFGGTTVIVVPNDASPEEKAAWLALEEDDPINKQSRFHRLRVAANEEGRRLSDVLETLHAARRDNVLIVPAVFCAEPGAMRALRGNVRTMEDRMTLHWLPGLGGSTVDVNHP